MSGCARGRKRSRNNTNRNRPNPHGPLALWNGSPSRTSRAEPRPAPAKLRTHALLRSLRVHEVPTNELTLTGGPGVRIPFPPAGSPLRTWRVATASYSFAARKYALVPLPVAVPRGTRLPFADALYFQMSRMCGSTFLPNSSSASISWSGCSEPGVWNDRSTTPAPI